jgi:hypothetical protein
MIGALLSGPGSWFQAWLRPQRESGPSLGDWRADHTHVIGMTGVGKIKALESQIMEDIEQEREDWQT